MVLAPLIFVVAVLWDRTLVDCQGGPETPAYYFFVATTRWVQQRICCCDEGGVEYDCSRMVAGVPVRFGPDVFDPGVGTSVQTDFDPVANPALLPEPGVGGMSAWPWVSAELVAGPVVAVDTSGNRGDQACPSP